MILVLRSRIKRRQTSVGESWLAEMSDPTKKDHIQKFATVALTLCKRVTDEPGFGVKNSTIAIAGALNIPTLPGKAYRRF
jgi:hypothetical protein